MIRLIRLIGWLMIVAGALALLTWLIEPLRFIWRALLALPLPMQIGLGAALAGLLLLLGSLLWERLEDRKTDRNLGDEDYGLHRPDNQDQEEKRS